ncbi:MAG TPA: DinB family protein [Blastocatellia bacterium]|nr:DinB family protein [Blastocatellia bacterium]
MGLNEIIIGELKHEANTTRKLLERVPEPALGWKPHEKSMSLGRLAGHVAELPGLIVPIVNQDELDFASGDYKPFTPTSRFELLEVFDKALSMAVDALQTATDEQLQKTWRLRSGDKVFGELPRIAMIRGLVLNHIIHHRGQLSVYLRLQDVPLPSIYGPSADEPM